MKTADQAIHDYLWKYLAASVKCYENRPSTEVGYPFADFDEFNSDFKGTKSGALAHISATVNIWGAEDSRGKVSELSYGLMSYAVDAVEMYGYKTSVDIKNSTIKIMQDKTVTPPVWRGMVTIVIDI